MRLIYSTSRTEVLVGDPLILSGRGGEQDLKGFVESIEHPRHAASTGRIYFRANDGSLARGYFPSVFDAEWIEREDQA